jgi:hypothetical protein
MRFHNLLLTVDGDSDTLGQDIAIGSFERWNLPKWVDFKVLFRNAIWINLNNLKIELILLRDSSDRC